MGENSEAVSEALTWSQDEEEKGEDGYYSAYGCGLGGILACYVASPMHKGRGWYWSICLDLDEYLDEPFAKGYADTSTSAKKAVEAALEEYARRPEEFMAKLLSYLTEQNDGVLPVIELLRTAVAAGRHRCQDYGSGGRPPWTIG